MWQTARNCIALIFDDGDNDDKKEEAVFFSMIKCVHDIDMISLRKRNH